MKRPAESAMPRTDESQVAQLAQPACCSACMKPAQVSCPAGYICSRRLRCFRVARSDSDGCSILRRRSPDCTINDLKSGFRFSGGNVQHHPPTPITGHRHRSGCSRPDAAAHRHRGRPLRLAPGQCGDRRPRYVEQVGDDASSSMNSVHLECRARKHTVAPCAVNSQGLHNFVHCPRSRRAAPRRAGVVPRFAVSPSRCGDAGTAAWWQSRR